MATTIDFNPRSPYGERPIPSSPRSVRSYFNPRSPHGERRYVHGQPWRRHAISIHAPRRGSDSGQLCTSGIHQKFQSTLPAGGATNQMQEAGRGDTISIHAPRMGSDLPHLAFPMRISNFNPRSPQGERQANRAMVVNMVQFQSTLPAWGATRHV